MGIFAAVALFKLETPLGTLPLRQFLMIFSSLFLQNGSSSVIKGFKRPSPDPFADGDYSTKGSGAKKDKPAAKKAAAKKKKDPNEPQK